MRKILNNYICKKNLHVPTDKYVFSIDLAQRTCNRKNLIKYKVSFECQSEVGL